MSAGNDVTSMLLVTVPEWGHLSPFLHLADSLERHWDGNKGSLELSLASMEHVRDKVESRGITFVSIGTWEGNEAKEYNRAIKASFDPSVSLVEKLHHGSTSMMQMMGLKMGKALMEHLEAAKQAGKLPDVLVTDGLTSAGLDAAEQFQLPLAVIWPHPLSMSLLLAGYAGHNMPAEVPVEFLQFNSPEDAHPLIRNCLNPALKRAVVFAANMLAAGRKNVRRQLGLPPLSPPVLRSSKDGTSRGQLNSWKGPLAVQPPVPRAIYLAGVTWELNARRELPPCWHMVGPMVVDRHHADFPPRFGPEDATVEAFLQAAADAGEPVVFTAAGSMTHLTQQQVDALVDTFTALTTGNGNGSGSSSGRVRVLWALRAEAQQLLPAHLRSSTTSSGKAGGDQSGSASSAADGSSSTGGGEQGSGIQTNSRLLVSAWVKQTAVLAHPSTKVFVTHGGLGSVHEALALGQAVPLVVPFSNGADHCTIGQQVASMGLGILLKPSELLRPGRLLGAIQVLLQKNEYRRRVADVAQRWEKLGYGPRMAAELVMEFATAAGGNLKPQEAA